MIANVLVASRRRPSHVAVPSHARCGAEPPTPRPRRASCAQCFHNDCSDDGTEFALLLEDLRNYRPGNQLESCSLAQAEFAVDAVARLHAQFWESPQLDEFGDWLPGPDAPYFTMLEQVYIANVPAFHEKFEYLSGTGSDLGLRRLSLVAGVGFEPTTFGHDRRVGR